MDRERERSVDAVISRRDLLKGFAVAGSAALAPSDTELLVTTISPRTTRLSVVPVGTSAHIVGDGSLVERGWPSPVARKRPSRGRTFEATVSGHRFTFDADSGTVTFPIGDGPLLGLGEGGPQFDRRGSTLTSRSGQGGYQLRTHGGRAPVQWLIDTTRWGVFIHHPYGTFDLTGREARFMADGGPSPIDLFIVSATDPATLMKEFAQLTGHPQMPPLWSLGYQQSHRTLASREEILEEAKTFREKKLPCDTMIYLGTGFCPSGWNTDNGEFEFNPKVFPDPPQMIRQLHDDHFKVVLHVVLEGKKLTGTVAERCLAAPLPSGRTPDGKWPDDRQVSCYWPVHKPLFDLGVDGLWPDQGDGLDPPSRLARNRMYCDGSREYRPNVRPFALHRNATAGMQRYGGFLWSGDVYSTWETLAAHVPNAVNTGLSGLPFWGTDIGGFVPTKELTGELYVRWFQFAAFCPLFRAHGRTWKLRLPWGWNTGDLRPDEIANYTSGASNPDASELHNAAVEPTCRKYLNLRYQLLPYLYSAVRETHTTGLPIVRAMWLHYADDPQAVRRGDQYLWGRDMLVAPVTSRGATSRRVYLPRGRWYDFWTNDAHEGGREIDRAVDLDTMPLFVRAGAILPLGPVKQYTSEPIDEPLTLQIYPGADGRTTVYEDDGETFDFERGEWTGLEARWNDRQRRVELRLASGSKLRPPLTRRLRVRLAGGSETHDVTFSGAPIATAVR
jgi:alpha-glucosidase/alpha-D-xyloside xylohydrolase